MRQDPGAGAELVADIGRILGVVTGFGVDIRQYVLVVEVIVDVLANQRQVLGIGFGRHADDRLVALEARSRHIVSETVDEPQRCAVTVVDGQKVMSIGLEDIDQALVLRLQLQRCLAFGAVIHVRAVGLDAVFTALVKTDGVVGLRRIGDAQAFALGEIVEFLLGAGDLGRVVQTGDVTQQAMETLELGDHRLGVGRGGIAIDDEMGAFAADPGVGIAALGMLLRFDDDRGRFVRGFLGLRQGWMTGRQKRRDQRRRQDFTHRAAPKIVHVHTSGHFTAQP